MRNLSGIVRPLIYVVGFSVFSACTTTRTVPVGDVPVSDESRNLAVVLSDGSRLEVKSATVSLEGIRGVITAEDSERLEVYFRTWRSAPLMRMALDGSLMESSEYTVVIPRSDLKEVQITKTNGWATALVVVGVALAFVALLVAVDRKYCNPGEDLFCNRTIDLQAHM